MNIDTLLRQVVVMPVLVIERADDAVPLARALAQGGLRVLEVTLRTPAALSAIAHIARALPGVNVGAGTVLNRADLHAAMDAGARFAVSPGYTAELARAVQEAGVPWLPGAMTASEVMQALQAGYDRLKFFPAREAGGPAMLRALAGPFPEVKFCPTGGITAESASEYFALDNVVCVGGSWVAPKAAIDTRDWATITRLAQQAVALRA